MENIGNMAEQLTRGAVEPDQRDEWNRLMSEAPHDQFSQAVTNAIRQVDPRQYQAHLDAASSGINSIGNLSRDQQVGLAQTLIGELAKIGLNTAAVSEASGVGNLDPRGMSVQDLIRLLGWVQLNHPEALGNVAARYQDHPNILAHLLGAQTLMAAVSNLDANRPAGEPGG